MKCLVSMCIAFICSLCWTFAAHVENSPGVQFVKYRDDKEFEQIQGQIIAHYEQLGGSSQVYGVQTAEIVDANNLKINL